jgi:hypothetical protein
MAAQVVFALIGFCLHYQACQTMAGLVPHQSATEQRASDCQGGAIVKITGKDCHAVILLDLRMRVGFGGVIGCFWPSLTTPIRMSSV